MTTGTEVECSTICWTLKKIVVHTFITQGANNNVCDEMSKERVTHGLNFFNWSSIGSFWSVYSLSVSAPISNSACNSRSCCIYLDRMSATYFPWWGVANCRIIYTRNWSSWPRFWRRGGFLSSNNSLSHTGKYLSYLYLQGFLWPLFDYQ